MSTITKSYFLICLIIPCSILGCWSSHSSELQLASQLRRSGDLEGAIKIYRKHIQSRLQEPDKAEGENPYFYELLIGDILLEQGKPTEAVKSFESAQSHAIDLALISDRIKQAARWLEKNGELEKAIDLLKSNRSVDELSIDCEIDRIYRKTVELDNAARKSEETMSNIETQ